MLMRLPRPALPQVTAGQAVLVSPAGAEGQPAQERRIASLSSASVYWKSLLIPSLWTASGHPLAETVCHADWLHAELSVRQGGQLLRLYQSLLAPSRPAVDAELSGPQLDVPIETDVCGLDVRLCQTGWCWAVSGSLSSTRCQLDGRPVLAAPQAGETAGTGGEKAVRALLQLPAATAAAADSCPLLVVVTEPALLCWQPTLLLWLSLATQLVVGQRTPPPPQPQPPPLPPPPPAVTEDRASSRSGRRSPAVDMPRPHGHSRPSRSARSATTERTTPTAPSPAAAAAAAATATPTQPTSQPTAPPLAWLPSLERLEVRLQISAVTVTVPAGSSGGTGGGADGDSDRTIDPVTVPPPPPPGASGGHHGAPVPGRVRSSSDPGRQYCLQGQLVSVLPSVRLDSAALKTAALSTVPEVPVLLTRPSAASGGDLIFLWLTYIL